MLSVLVWDCCKPTNTCRDWVFGHDGFEVGLPAFQLPMFSKCDALPKGNLWDMLVGFRNPFPLFFISKDELVRVNYWVGSHNPARTSGLKFELWISDGFEWFFVVNILYPQFAVLARSKQLILMPVTVKFRLDFLVCGLPAHLLWHLAKLAPCFHVTKAMRAIGY